MSTRDNQAKIEKKVRKNVGGIGGHILVFDPSSNCVFHPTILNEKIRIPAKLEPHEKNNYPYV